MDFKGTIPLETDRLVLRAFNIEDAEAMYENWASDPEVTKYLRWLPHKSVEESKNILENVFISGYQDLENMNWGIEVKETKELIGSIGLLTLRDETADFGYCIGKKYWGKGFMTEAGKAVLNYAFDTVGFNRVTGYHSVKNPASGMVMRKIGLKYEGFAREKYISALGESHDAYMYGLTKKEYFGNMDISFKELLEKAMEKVGYRSLSAFVSAGSVAAAILSEKNNIYTGVCIDAACSVGFCAEQSAIAEMVANGESIVKKIVAVNQRGVIYPPCGRCREFLSQLNSKNIFAEVLVETDKAVRLKELMPYNWTETKISQFQEEIDSERLTLKILDSHMTKDVFDNFNSDVTTYMYPAPPKKIEESQMFVDATLEKIKNGVEAVYAITLKESGEFLGLCGIHNIPSGSPELGIWTKKSAHGNGYGFEAISTLISYLRQTIPFNHIIYPVDKRNRASRRIPIMHGGTLQREYEVVNQSGETLYILEYRID